MKIGVNLIKPQWLELVDSLEDIEKSMALKSGHKTFDLGFEMEAVVKKKSLSIINKFWDTSFAIDEEEFKMLKENQNEIMAAIDKLIE